MDSGVIGPFEPYENCGISQFAKLAREFEINCKGQRVCELDFGENQLFQNCNISADPVLSLPNEAVFGNGKTFYNLTSVSIPVER